MKKQNKIRINFKEWLQEINETFKKQIECYIKDKEIAICEDNITDNIVLVEKELLQFCQMETISICSDYTEDITEILINKLLRQNLEKIQKFYKYIHYEIVFRKEREKIWNKDQPDSIGEKKQYLQAIVILFNK